MKKLTFLKSSKKKEHKAQDLVDEVVKGADSLPEILKGISSENPKVKFKSAEILRQISDKAPKILYSNFDFFVDLLESKNRIIKWEAIDVIGNLTSVDSKNKFDKIFNEYYGFLAADSMITIAHVIDNSAKIAKAKPYLTERITDELLKIENLPTKPPITQECKNILTGKAILVFDEFFNQIKNKAPIISFVKKQVNNTRNATKVKADKFLKKNKII
jgi:hypothetical protein